MPHPLELRAPLRMDIVPGALRVALDPPPAGAPLVAHDGTFDDAADGDHDNEHGDGPDPRPSYRTVILSDVHLGTASCKAAEVNHFLKHVRCETLILNGDIIDGWYLRRANAWSNQHTRFIRLVLKKVEKKNTRVVYLRGNHDDFLSRVLPLSFTNVSFTDEYIHTTARGSYLVLHGDVFDVITTRIPLLSHLGDIGYHALLNLNRLYNRYRAWRGKEYFSLSRAIKARVKSAVNYVSSFEDHIAALAERKGCTGVICGHIHTPADKQIGSVHYLNSGDWVESLTAIVEHHDGRMELIEFSEFCRAIPMAAPAPGAPAAASA